VKLKAEKIQAWMEFEPMTPAIVVQCSTNWAVAMWEPITLRVRNIHVEGVVFLEATKASNSSNTKSHFQLTHTHTHTHIPLVMWPQFPALRESRMSIGHYRRWRMQMNQIYEIKYIWSAEKDMKTWLIIAVIHKA